ncbi:hypothetical protein GIB67_026375 [Kingdonia uniflora]|uniref:beta-galactosidase n=1 Tax=Kingdonia uniflora TaxID=39325 RepID=A0A7J7P604_9MAGN|nr:hypothetical protein GIB67_026375 [Kingdonia uniflora]
MSCFVVVRASVTYDHKAIIVNGHRKILISGSIHYQEALLRYYCNKWMWPDLIQKPKDGGLDVIQACLFWNGHEPSPGKYNFEERYDLVRFIKLVKQSGLYVHLRVGPYVFAEWNFGGFPVWLKYVPGISFRTDNEPFKIENEYGPMEYEIGNPGREYTKRAADMAVSLGTGVPWIMCKQDDAPDPIVSISIQLICCGEEYFKVASPDSLKDTYECAIGKFGVPWYGGTLVGIVAYPKANQKACKGFDELDISFKSKPGGLPTFLLINTYNGFYCDNFSPNKAYKPKMWTEAFTGWFTAFRGTVPCRPAENLAFSVARFIQKGGSFINYYMYHGGTNFGRTAAGRFIATSYDYDAPIDEYGV